MDLSNLIAISAMPGIYKMAVNRKNGLIVEDIDTGKRKFVSSRKHQFTPLESISIYTLTTESVELKDVFRKMQEAMEFHPVPSAKEKSEVLREYLNDVLPQHDPERVYISDIKKLVKWFTFLNERNLLEEKEEVAETTETDSPKEETEENSTEA